MNYFLVFLFLPFILSANIADIPSDDVIKVKGKFSKNKKCIRCHLDIYKEFKHSKHRHSNILNNPLHKTMWDANPLSREQKYVCVECHAPASENLEAVMSGESHIQNDDKSILDGVSCAFCHRIEDIHQTPKGDKYKVSNEKRTYFGTRDNKERSDYHKIKTDNKHYKNGDICLTCHTHHKKQKMLILREDNSSNKLRYCVFSKVDKNTAKISSNTESENCITCHMPQVEGSLSDRVNTKTHAYHGFSTLSQDLEKPQKYIDVEFAKDTNAFKITIHNKTPHDLILHPTRLFTLKIFINKKLFKTVEFKKEWSADKYKPLSWLKEEIIYKNNVLAKSKKSVKVDYPLKDKDTVRVVLGYHRLNPEIAKEIGFDHKDSLKYRVLVDKNF